MLFISLYFAISLLKVVGYLIFTQVYGLSRYHDDPATESFNILYGEKFFLHQIVLLWIACVCLYIYRFPCTHFIHSSFDSVWRASLSMQASCSFCQLNLDKRHFVFYPLPGFHRLFHVLTPAAPLA